LREAEIHRSRGEVLRGAEDHASAEACFRTAIDSARQAQLWELRLSVSLAQMLPDQGNGRQPATFSRRSTTGLAKASTRLT
jgi:hypothetical protein